MANAERILIVEDEAAIRTGLLDVLVFHGYEAEGVADGLEGLDRALTGQFDLILLDVMLPSKNGFDICNEVRAKDSKQPIIMLTAKNSDDDIIQGLTLGADDYVAKPFSVTQLLLRIKAVLRRSKSIFDQAVILKCHDGLTIDLAGLSGTRGKDELAFTRRETEILMCLAKHQERPVAREELLHEVWGYAKGLDLDTRTVDIHIAKLRRKIETNPKSPQNLVTIRGAGYRLKLAGQSGDG
ncbi:MAG: response regulator transcription factor [Pseudomonadota bacterium]